MPELPEAERARAASENDGLDREVASVDDRDSWVCRPHSPGELDSGLRGHRLTDTHRRGKAIWAETDGGPILGLHLGMTGRIVVDPRPAPTGSNPAGLRPDQPPETDLPERERWDHFVIYFRDGGRLAFETPPNR